MQSQSAETANTATTSKSYRTAILAGAVVFLVIALAGVSWRSMRATSGVSWSGTLLGGPEVALSPRISPDGHTLAFETVVDNQSQVAVMNPDSGNWTVLTKDRSRGMVLTICWSRDGSRIYFDRFDGVPRGIFSVPALGGEERLVLEDAGGPEILNDGALVVRMINPQRQLQMYHFTPQTAELKALSAYARYVWAPVRTSTDGREVVFYGRSADQAESDIDEHVYVLDLASNSSQRLGSNLTLVTRLGLDAGSLPIAWDPAKRSVLMVAMRAVSTSLRQPDSAFTVATPSSSSSRSPARR